MAPFPAMLTTGNLAEFCMPKPFFFFFFFCKEGHAYRRQR